MNGNTNAKACIRKVSVSVPPYAFVLLQNDSALLKSHNISWL